MHAHSRGITMIELLITLAVVVILASLAVPDLQTSTQRAASETVVTELARLMARGRAEAVTHGSIVSLCSLQADALPAPRCRRGDWRGPLTLFTDHNGDSALNGTDRLLAQQLLPAVAGTLYFSSFPAGRAALQFTQLGFTNHQTGNFLWCASNGDATTAHQLIFSNTGRTRLARDSNGDGIRENTSRRNLECP